MKHEKLEALQRRQDALATRITQMKAAEKENQRKQENRIVVLIGTAVLAALKAYPESAQLVSTILDREVTAPRDRELLLSRDLIQNAGLPAALGEAGE